MLYWFYRGRNGILAGFNTALVIALGMAILWWGIGLFLRTNHVIPIWTDQQNTFTKLTFHLANPYQAPNFVNPPWAAVLMIPFGYLSLPAAVLIQACLFFVLLTIVMFKFGGNARSVAIALTTYLTLFAVNELNLDWLVLIGLLIPATYSGLFLLIKPQNALGYWLSLTPYKLLFAVLGTLIVGLVSLVLWPNWPAMMFSGGNNLTARVYNLAPMAVLPRWLSALIAIWFGWKAIRRHDPIRGIWAWLFIVPYIGSYSLVLAFALLAVRHPRIALIVNIASWLTFGPTFLHQIAQGLGVPIT